MQQEFAFDRERTIDERFAVFASNHGDVLELFERFARELRSAGHKRAGAKLLVERIRYEKLTSAHGAGTPAINNDFTSRLARWLIERDSSFADFFETRRLKSSG